MARGRSEQAAVLTFWEPGASGKHEMIGVRGQSRFDVRSEPTVETIDGRQYPGRSAFPVGNGLERFSGDVDVVYTWVDGSDERWRADFDEWSRREGRDHAGDRDLVAGRYRDNDELRHSLRSLWFCCDWVRKIFLVTADQIPAWLDTDHQRIEVVSHRDILPESCLPTFNSHAIEAALHRIEGLSEHFVVLQRRRVRRTTAASRALLHVERVAEGVPQRRTGDRGGRRSQLAVDNAAMRRSPAVRPGLRPCGRVQAASRPVRAASVRCSTSSPSATPTRSRRRCITASGIPTTSASLRRWPGTTASPPVRR